MGKNARHGDREGENLGHMPVHAQVVERREVTAQRRGVDKETQPSKTRSKAEVLSVFRLIVTPIPETSPLEAQRGLRCRVRSSRSSTQTQSSEKDDFLSAGSMPAKESTEDGTRKETYRV